MTMDEYKNQKYYKEAEKYWNSIMSIVKKSVFAPIFEESVILANDKKMRKIIKGEGPEEGRIRSSRILKHYLSLHKNEDTMVVSHGGVITTMLAKHTNVHEISLGNNFGKYTNCHITIINKKNKQVIMMLYTKHLD